MMLPRSTRQHSENSLLHPACYACAPLSLLSFSYSLPRFRTVEKSADSWPIWIVLAGLLLNIPPEARQPLANPVYRTAGAHRRDIALIFPSQVGRSVFRHIEVIDRVSLCKGKPLILQPFEKWRATKHCAAPAALATSGQWTLLVHQFSARSSILAT